MQAAGVTHGRPAIRRFNTCRYDIATIGNRNRNGRRARIDHVHQRLASGDRPAVGTPVDAVGVAVLDDQHGHHRFAVALEHVDVELNERLAGANRLAFGHARRKTFALEQYGIDADVQEHAHTVGGFEHARVMRAMQLRDGTVARRVEDARARVDGQAVAEHAPGEHWIGNRLDRNDDTTCKSGQFQVRKTHHSLQKPGPSRQNTRLVKRLSATYRKPV